jgi:hypothetical protein
MLSSKSERVPEFERTTFLQLGVIEIGMERAFFDGHQES